jgi:putative transposase
MTVLTQTFLRELRAKHDVSEAVFLTDHAYHLSVALNRAGLRFQTILHGNLNAVERIFREIKCRTSLLSNSFSHVDPATAET